ncbi:hypothetical protein [Cobetia crustatorum]|uniref:Uncharacterized protein n=1 Tax=Cobetia crustatorum TaxID=553385 RepID=A0A558HHR3_9GAMM|nr:hypothetical protein [Cobetia crustatorum]TVU68686.1 hypothetical protein FQP86_12885 [Cobetia crustatorum]
MADYPVKWFSNDMGGAPVLGDTSAGDFIALLKACLITGFNVTPVASATYEAESGEVLVTLTTGHGFKAWQVIEVSGADQESYNGQHRVTSIGSDWVRYVPSAAPSVSPATGTTIEIKAAAVGGWEIVGEDSNSYRVAIRSTSVKSTDHVLVITNDGDDQSSYGNYAKMICAESFVDIDTFDSAITQYWPCSHARFDESVRYGGAEEKSWLLISDDRLLYFIPVYSITNRRSIMVAGVFNSFRPGDAYNFLLNGISTGGGSAWHTTNQDCLSDLIAPVDSGMRSRASDLNSDSQSPKYTRIARYSSQFPGDVPAGLMLTGLSFARPEYYIDPQVKTPNPADNGLYVNNNNLPLLEPGGIRGEMPGLLQPINGSAAYDKQVIDSLPSFSVPVLFWRAAAWRKNYTPGSYNEGYDCLLAFKLDEWRYT